ncbi:MAG TPA: metallophosphoesterase [Sedimentibacter sp.]|nr:metallophosphoesterase [Sedimentibacter sp.]HNZ82976.1 metallophosphoesterase [Sedimentibacter sp.]HOH69241.1 metallophosphoesterase [Sedimentibacter sp.]HPX00428.1 metallophosphoesterase [Sedimentibacter sp.]
MRIKFIHTSDLHLGKKFDIKNFSLKERKKRRQELMDSFDEIIWAAKINEVKYLFIAGDLTEGEYISYKVLNEISSKLRSIPGTRAIISCGQSDPCNISNMYEYIQWPHNVHLIKNTETVEKLNFPDDNLCIYSISWDNHEENRKTQSIYDISVDDSKINILMLHCHIDSTDRLPVNIDVIRNKFDYCPLGGRHNFEQITDNAVYCGAPEPLSFEEEGDHGIITGTLEKKNVQYTLLPIAKRKFVNRRIELNYSHSYNKILDLIKFSGDTFSNIKDYVHIELTGGVNTDISMDEIENEAKQFFYYIEFEDNYIYETENRNYEGNEYNIVESYKLQFDNNDDKLQQQAFKLGLEVLRKEKVVK